MASPKRRRWPRVTLLIASDGRAKYLQRAWESAQVNLRWDWHEVVVVDDSDDLDHKRWLDDLINPDCIVTPGPARMGGAAALRAAAEYLRETNTDYIFRLEEDFTFPGAVPLRGMVTILEDYPSVANVVLRRQPCGNEGRDGPLEGLGHVVTETLPHWIKHRRGFWLNPCLYRRGICDFEWPEHGHEHHFTEQLLTAGYEFAFYGDLADPPRCIHIGEERSEGWTW